MVRYFFHLNAMTDSEEDEGQEFSTPDAAVAEAHEVARELAHNRSESEMRGWKLRVTDGTGAEVAIITFADGPTVYGLELKRPPNFAPYL
jgi:Domain of unknown function (DUF6894)